MVTLYKAYEKCLPTHGHATTRVSLESLEALEASASDLEGQLNDAEMITALTSIDLLSLRARVTSVKTTIVTLRTDAERLRLVSIPVKDVVLSMETLFLSIFSQYPLKYDAKEIQVRETDKSLTAVVMAGRRSKATLSSGGSEERR